MKRRQPGGRGVHIFGSAEKAADSKLRLGAFVDDHGWKFVDAETRDDIWLRVVREFRELNVVAEREHFRLRKQLIPKLATVGYVT